MIKARYYPSFLAASFYEIPVSFYQKLGIKNLLLDLDNTLAPYHGGAKFVMGFLFD